MAEEIWQQHVKAAAARLSAVGIDGARLDAEIMLAHVLGLDRLHLYGHPVPVIGQKQKRQFESCVRRRLEFEPVAYITGHREFWSLDFRVTPDTLIPRPDSETMIGAVLARLQRQGISKSTPVRILDLGTGSGCLLLSLLSELPFAWGVGIDRSPAAVQVAHENAQRLGFRSRAAFCAGDWTSALAVDRLGQSKTENAFDLILANPPYIPVADIAGLAPDVKNYEPLSALAAGDDGLDEYRRLAGLVKDRLTDDGAAFFEIGAGQAGDVTRLLVSAGASFCRNHKDFGAIERCIEAEFQ